MKKKCLVILTLSLVLIGCGNEVKTQEETTKIPTNYSNKVLNNRGLVVEGKINNYHIQIYSNSQIKTNPKNIHKGVVVNINESSSETMPIEIGYVGKHIIVAIYDTQGNEIAVSPEIKVTNLPVIVVDMKI